jgi:hypothetical protein
MALALETLTTAQKSGIQNALGFDLAPSAPCLGAYFTTASESLQLAISFDGKTFVQFATDLMDGPNNTLRDPSIILRNGVWYCAFTNNSFNTTTSFTIYKSTDLLTWTSHATVSLSAISGLSRVWSPQLFIDTDDTVHAYVAGNDGSVTDTYGEFSIYHLLGNSALSSWGAPTAILSRAAGTKHYIDPWVIKDGSTYYLWVKEEYDDYIEVASSTSPDSGFSLVETGDWAGWGADLEGIVVNKTTTGFRLYVDRYLAGTGIEYAESASMLSGWGALTGITMDGSVFRHGSVYPLTTHESAIRVASVVAQLGLTGGSGDMLSTLTAAEISVTTTATATISRMHVCSGTTANYTVTLPAASGNAGKLIGFRMAGGLTKLITIDGNASETIDGATTRIMWANEVAILLCDGTGWTKIAGKSIPMVAYLSLVGAQSLTSGAVTKVTLDTIVTNSAGMANTASSRIDIVRPGNVTVIANTLFDNMSAASADTQARIHKNGTVVSSDSRQTLTGGYPSPSKVDLVPVVAGDYIELFGLHGSGSAEDLYVTIPVNTLQVKEEISW